MSQKESIKVRIADKLAESIRLKQTVAENSLDRIEEMVTLITDSLRSGGKIIIFGNGGSASDAQHIAAELVGKLLIERQAMPAICLNTNTSIITAVANDYGYDRVFSRQVEALAADNDLVIGLSTSGNSVNVNEAIKTAKNKGLKTVGLSGGNGGELAEIADTVLVVPSSVTPRVQETHITIGHIICELVEQNMVANDNLDNAD